MQDFEIRIWKKRDSYNESYNEIKFLSKNVQRDKWKKLHFSFRISKVEEMEAKNNLSLHLILLHTYEETRILELHIFSRQISGNRNWEQAA